MLLYPVIYVVTVLPLASFRLAAIAGHPWSSHAQLGTGTVFTLSGAADVIVYSLTRQIVTFERVRFPHASRRSGVSAHHPGKRFHLSTDIPSPPSSPRAPFSAFAVEMPTAPLSAASGKRFQGTWNQVEWEYEECSEHASYTM